MTLAELIAEVYTLTGRPDRVAETLSAVRSATLTCHQSDYYYKDFYEQGVAFTSPEFIQDFDYRALVPRYRAYKYFRKYDPLTDTMGKILKLIPSDLVLDDYSVTKTDVCYVAGSQIRINSSTQEQYYVFGCYIHPDITPASFDSWIALDHPWAIIFRAAGIVFKAIGKDEEAAANKVMSDEQVQLIRMSNIVAEGF